MFHYSFFVLVSFVALASSSLVTFTIGLKFYCTPFTPVPAVTQQQPFNFTLSLFTSCSLFTYDTMQSVAGRTFLIHLLFTFSHYSHLCIKYLCCISSVTCISIPCIWPLWRKGNSSPIFSSSLSMCLSAQWSASLPCSSHLSEISCLFCLQLCLLILTLPLSITITISTLFLYPHHCHHHHHHHLQPHVTTIAPWQQFKMLHALGDNILTSMLLLFLLVCAFLLDEITASSPPLISYLTSGDLSQTHM